MTTVFEKLQRGYLQLVTAIVSYGERPQHLKYHILTPQNLQLTTQETVIADGGISLPMQYYLRYLGRILSAL